MPKKKTKSNNYVAKHYLKNVSPETKRLDDYVSKYGELVALSEDLFEGIHVYILLDQRGKICLL